LRRNLVKNFRPQAGFSRPVYLPNNNFNGDMKMQTTATMTTNQIREKFSTLLVQVEGLTVHKTGVIQDYPIGGTNRGKCALQVETNKRGWRTLKTTTNKHGRWCKPHASTYRSVGQCFVVSGDIVEKDFAWLSIDGEGGITLTAANHECTEVFARPFSSYWVRRKAEVSYGTHYEADAPEVIEAWDEWISGLQAIGRMLSQKLASVPAEELAEV
jgi:hypothetical protein